jgi:hypothetical protein
MRVIYFDGVNQNQPLSEYCIDSKTAKSQYRLGHRAQQSNNHSLLIFYLEDLPGAILLLDLLLS